MLRLRGMRTGGLRGGEEMDVVRERPGDETKHVACGFALLT